MNNEEFELQKWLAIYGASVALQCHQQKIDGKGSDFSNTMSSIKEEAEALADWALEESRLRLASKTKEEFTIAKLHPNE